MSIVLSREQLPPLYRQVQDLALQPESNAEELHDLTQLLQEAQLNFPVERPAIQDALALLGHVFARISEGAPPHAQQAAAPLNDREEELEPQYEEQLLPAAGPFDAFSEDELTPADAVPLDAFNEVELTPAAQEQMLAQFARPANAQSVQQHVRPAVQSANAQSVQQHVRPAVQPANAQSVQQHVQPAVQPANAQSVQQHVQPAVQPAQNAPQANAVASQTPAPIAPLTNVSAIPAAQPEALEPNLLNKILQIFQSAIETLCLWFTSFIAYCSSCFFGSSEQTVAPPGQSQTSLQVPAQNPAQNQGEPTPIPVQPAVAEAPALAQALAQNQGEPTPIPVQPAVAEAPALAQAPAQNQGEPAPIAAQPAVAEAPALAQAPAQNQGEPAPIAAQPAVAEAPAPAQAQPAEADAEAPANLVQGRFQGVAHLERGADVARGDECVKAMAAKLWNYLEGNGGNENQFYRFIPQAFRGEDANTIEDWQFPRYGFPLTQDYRAEVRLININAEQARHIKAVQITKGNEVHLVMIDARNRNRNQVWFYYFNPYMEDGAYLQKFNNFDDLTNHLVEAVPIEANNPFVLTAIRPLQD